MTQNLTRPNALHKTKFEVVEVVNQNIQKNSGEKLYPIFKKKINRQVVKYDSVCIEPYIPFKLSKSSPKKC